MKQFVDDETIEQAHKELTAARKILIALKKVKDPLMRARVLRASAELLGHGE